MASYSLENDSVGGGYGGFGGGGWSVMILFFVIAFVLFRRDGFDGGHHDGWGGRGGCDGCGPCVRPSFIDESNYQEERNIDKKLCEVDKDVHADGEKTRALIEANYIQDLRDRLSEKNAEVLTLKSEAFTTAKFDQLAAMIGKTDTAIDRLACEIPHRPPVWADVRLPAEKVCFNECGVRRGRVDFDDCCA
jgi:hypothetical protein